jgi:hypothetical protein
VVETGEASRLKIFISYSRRDCSAFAQELLTGLELVGFAPFLDLHDIAAGEDWEARLAGLIKAADTVVFVVSPEAVKSERCAWEVERALALTKRVIPIVALPVPEADVPPVLKRLNYIFFNESHSFARALGQLADALRVDLDWIREHTRLAELASRWQARGGLDVLLLRGAELDAANAWLAGWKSGAPEVTDHHRAFIAASSEAETARKNQERQQLEEMAKAQAARALALSEREMAVKQLSRRTMAGLIGAGTLTAAAAGLAYWGMDAERRFRDARERAEEARKRSIEELIRQEAGRTDIEGQIVAYAASPGQFPPDGPPGGNSPYTKIMLAELADPMVSLQAALSRATRKVMDATNVRPFLSSDLNGDIYLLQQPPTRRRKAIVVSVDSIRAGSTKFDNVERDALAWEAFLKRCGFDTTRSMNPTKEEFIATLERVTFGAVEKQTTLPGSLVQRVAVEGLSATAPPNTLVFLFYAGTGAYINGQNCIAPFGTDISNVATAERTTITLSAVQDALRRRAAASILVLDTGFPEPFVSQQVPR